MDQEEYELVPLNPIRKMERRVEKLEKTTGSNEMVKELVDVVRTNQEIVNEMVKINSEIINKVNDLTESVNQTIAKIDEFLSKVEVSGEVSEGSEAPAETPAVNEKIERLEKRINSLILSTMARRGVKVNRPQQTA